MGALVSTVNTRRTAATRWTRRRVSVWNLRVEQRRSHWSDVSQASLGITHQRQELLSLEGRVSVFQSAVEISSVFFLNPYPSFCVYWLYRVTYEAWRWMRNLCRCNAELLGCLNTQNLLKMLRLATVHWGPLKSFKTLKPHSLTLKQ